MKKPSRNNGQEPTNYGFLCAIEQAFQSPYRLLKNRFLSRRKKEEILEEWQEGRQKMLYEQGRDRDYEKDDEIREIDRTLRIVRGADGNGTRNEKQS